MSEERLSKQKGQEVLPELDDDNFCVSITRASELSGLSESQIRYLETLDGVNIGRRGPGERNRVYTKQHVKLLRWIGQQGDVRPSAIAQQFIQKQEEILREVEGHITLQQIVDNEQAFAGLDILISRLVSFLLSIWQQAVQSEASRGEAVIWGVIFGPQDKNWKASFNENARTKRPINLAGSIVVWSAITTGDTQEVKSLLADPNNIFGNYHIIFSEKSWYLPTSSARLIYDTSHFSHTSEPFAVAILWFPLTDKQATIKKLQTSANYIDEPKRKLIAILMKSLLNVRQRFPEAISVPISIFSRGVMGRHSVLRGLSLLLETCIQPYFPDCYTYIAKFESSGKLEILKEFGGEFGYLRKALANQETPWWITFVQQTASLALAVNSQVSDLHKGEQGSVVCFPLIVLEKLVGVLGIEVVSDNEAMHCLADRDGRTAVDLLRYLICIAEIAAEYLNLMESSSQKAERSKLAYTRDETVAWWLDVYQFGGLNYKKFTDEIASLLQGTVLPPNEVVDLILVDIHKEDELAKKYQGIEVIVDIARRTRTRIAEMIQKDPIAKDFAAKSRLILHHEPIGEHLLLAAIGIPRHYLLIFLDQVRKLWQQEGDMFKWKENNVIVVLQVAVCRFTDLASYEQAMISQITNYHLRKLVHMLYDRQRENAPPLNTVLEYEAEVVTEKVRE